MTVDFELWWGGKNRQRRRFRWTAAVQWTGVPRAGDHVSLEIPHPDEEGSWTVRDVEWHDGSVRIRLVDIWTSEHEDTSTTVQALRRFTEQHGGHDDYDRTADEWINPDDGVKHVVRMLEALEPWTPYEIGLRLPGVTASMRYAYKFIVVSLVMLLLILFTWPIDGVWRLPCAIALGLVVWRTADIARWYLDLFLDRAHSHLVSTERNLLMTILNLVELVVIGAILFRATDVTEGERAALYESFLLVTQLDVPSGIGGDAYQAVAVVGVEIVALLLLLGAIAALIAEIQEKLITSRVWRGERK